MLPGDADNLTSGPTTAGTRKSSQPNNRRLQGRPHSRVGPDRSLGAASPKGRVYQGSKGSPRPRGGLTQGDDLAGAQGAPSPKDRPHPKEGSGSGLMGDLTPRDTQWFQEQPQTNGGSDRVPGRHHSGLAGLGRGDLSKGKGLAVVPGRLYLQQGWIFYGFSADHTHRGGSVRDTSGSLTKGVSKVETLLRRQRLKRAERS
jgi:hypothetical protein